MGGSLLQWFTESCTRTSSGSPLEFIDQQFVEMRKGRGAEGKKLSVKGAWQEEKLYSKAWKNLAVAHVTAILEDLVKTPRHPGGQQDDKINLRLY